MSETPADYEKPARDLAVGDRYRQLGPGYQARTIESVERTCNCQLTAGMAVSREPVTVPEGHNGQARGIFVPRHFDVVYVTSQNGRHGSVFIPGQMVTVTEPEAAAGRNRGADQERSRCNRGMR